MFIGSMINSQTITGYIRQTHQISGTIGIPSASTQPNTDHQFISVDLLKFHTQVCNVLNATAMIPFSSTNLQLLSRTLDIHLSATNLIVNYLTITADMEAYNHVNE